MSVLHVIGIVVLADVAIVSAAALVIIFKDRRSLRRWQKRTEIPTLRVVKGGRR